MIDERWFLTDGQSQIGPLTLEALREELARPDRGLARVVWREGMKEWAPAITMPEFASAAMAASKSARSGRLPRPRAGPSRANRCSCSG